MCRVLTLCGSCTLPQCVSPLYVVLTVKVLNKEKSKAFIVQLCALKNNMVCKNLQYVLPLVKAFPGFTA